MKRTRESSIFPFTKVINPHHSCTIHSGPDRLLRPRILGFQASRPALRFCGPAALLVALAESGDGGAAADLRGY